ncbi:MAG: TMEM175 family protein [Saprospiraceae bacterium]
MTKTRLEAFSDGVLAIIITIMVLEMKTPHEASWHSLVDLKAIFISYILSFVGVAIYWVNHHHLIQAIKNVSSAILWTNINLLFWLSLTPFVTGWMGESHFENAPVILYTLNCILCGMAYFFLLIAIRKTHKQHSYIMEIISYQSKKGLISAGLYFIALIIGFFYTPVSIAIIIIVALIWIIPDKNIEKILSENPNHH